MAYAFVPLLLIAAFAIALALGGLLVMGAWLSSSEQLADAGGVDELARWIATPGGTR